MNQLKQFDWYCTALVTPDSNYAVTLNAKCNMGGGHDLNRWLRTIIRYPINRNKLHTKLPL